MIRSRRFALAAVAVGFALASCGDPNTTTPLAEKPPVIKLAAGQAGGNAASGAATASAENATPAAADTKVAFVGPTDFVYDGDLPALDAPAASWFFDANQQPDLDRIAKLAASLGVQGDVRTLPTEQGGGWAVGPEDYSGPVLTVSSDAMHSWYLSAAPSTSVGYVCAAGQATVSAVAPDASAPLDAPPAPAAEGPTTSLVPVDAPVCPAPAPPPGVPSKDDAIAKATQLFADWGYDMSSYQVDDVYADDYSANVNAYLVLDGMRAPVVLSVGFGENAAVTYASGYLGDAQRGADYPIIGAAAGLERLKKQQTQLLGPGDVRAMSSSGVAAAGSGVAQPAVAEPAIAVAPCQTGPATDCAPVEGQPVTITLNSVKPDLTMVWDESNTVWLLPAYTFGTADGSQYTVIAVDDAYIQQSAPSKGTTDTTPAGGFTTYPDPATTGVTPDTGQVEPSTGPVEPATRSSIEPSLPSPAPISTTP